MILYAKNICLDKKMIEGYITIEDGKITKISPDIAPGETFIDHGDKIIIPGYIDIHIHGWA